MKILYIITQADGGGAQKYVLTLAKHFGGIIAAGDEADELFKTAQNLKIPSYKLRHLKDKLILRRAAAKFLPEEICSRPKVAYQAPEIRPFISKEGKVSDLVGQYLSEERIKEFDLFDGGVVNTLLKKIQGSDQSRLGMRDNMAFVQVLSTQIFTDLFLKSSFRNKAQEQLRANKIPFTKRLQSSAAVLNKR
jgi:asparagine synthetase B (glutamine-hydrolysing)